MYRQKLFEGKGQGTVATSDIAKGTRILSEHALFTLTKTDHAMAAASYIVDSHDISKKLSFLSEQDQDAFFGLHNAYQGVKNPLKGIEGTNAMPVGRGHVDGGSIIKGARFNHSCRPNCHWVWIEQLGQMAFHATQDTAAGDEITVNSGVEYPYAERQFLIRPRFNFDCKCSECLLPEPERYQTMTRSARSVS